MITSMCDPDVICITNRHLCEEDFFVQVDKIAQSHPKAIILREKDLDETSYERMAIKVLKICEKHGCPCILHTYVRVAQRLQVTGIHLPLPILTSLTKEERDYFKVLGASCHSVSDGMLAEEMGCTYITAGHIFDTDCKKGLPGRGLAFLKEICASVEIPVYAIGGISSENFKHVQNAGAKGGCIMSSIMKAKNPKALLDTF